MSRNDLFSLDGASVLVVGAGGVLGRRAALVVGRLGASVTVADHGGARQALEETVSCLRDDDVEVVPLICDVTNESSVDECFEATSLNHGLDVLINAAGVMFRKSVVDASLVEWRGFLDVNLTGTWLLNRAAG